METKRRALAIAAGVAISAVGGAVFAWMGTPLPWMLGAIFATAAAQVAGAKIEAMPGARPVAFIVVGTSLGLYFSAPVMEEVARQWPWFVALGFAALGLGSASAWVLRRLSGVDRTTAYFGSMPGGAAEMALMGERYGAKPDRVALSHSVRLVTVVTLYPVCITLAGFHATEDYRAITIPFDAARLALLFAITGSVGVIARLLRVPTAFMIGALATSIALTATGHTFSSVPAPFTNAAQVFLGCALGARFERDFIAAAPRFLMAVVPAVIVTLVLAILVGVGLSWGSGAYLGGGILAAAPGGVAEMSLTAKVLHINVAFVTAAHVIRYAIVVLLTIPIYRVFLRPRP